MQQGGVLAGKVPPGAKIGKVTRVKMEQKGGQLICTSSSRDTVVELAGGLALAHHGLFPGRELKIKSKFNRPSILVVTAIQTPEGWMATAPLPPKKLAAEVKRKMKKKFGVIRFDPRNLAQVKKQLRGRLKRSGAAK